MFVSLESLPCKVWDYKFPLVILPTASLKKKKASMQHAVTVHVFWNLPIMKKHWQITRFYPTKNHGCTPAGKGCRSPTCGEAFVLVHATCCRGRVAISRVSQWEVGTQEFTWKAFWSTASKWLEAGIFFWGPAHFFGVQLTSSIWICSHGNKNLNVNHMT